MAAVADRLLAGFILPHAPVLVDPSLEERPWLHLSAACGVLFDRSLESAEIVVVCSPHARSAGVYEVTSGDLGPQGLAHVSATWKPSPAAGRLAETWEQPLLGDTPADHGVVVPLALGAIPSGVEVIACGLPEWTGQHDSDPSEALSLARSLASAVRDLASDRDVAFVASAHGSAALSPRAPLTERPEGVRLERRLHDGLTGDVRSLADIPGDVWLAGGCCGAGPLTALAELVSGRAEVLAYDDSYGVGYHVARWT